MTVMDTRDFKRRRRCRKCNKRFNTVEVVATDLAFRDKEIKATATNEAYNKAIADAITALQKLANRRPK